MVFAIVDKQSSPAVNPGQVFQLSDETASRDKTLTYNTTLVSGRRMRLLSLRVELTTSTGVLVRRIRIQIQDSGNDVLFEKELATTFNTASSAHTWQLALDQEEFVGIDQDQERLPSDLYLLPGQTLHVDEADNRNAADTMQVHLVGMVE